MTKLELEALRTLPRRYVQDGTQICVWEPPALYPMVVAMNAKLPPIAYHSRGRKWKRMELHLTDPLI